jgi:hypothetical protein
MRHSQSPRDRSPAQPRTGKPFRAPARDGVVRMVVAAVLSCRASQAIGEGPPKRFTDPEDGKLDPSALLDHKGFPPVPIVITEPAVGYGAGVALAFSGSRCAIRRSARRMSAPRAARHPASARW